MASKRKCRECGCTEERACMTLAGPCHWVAEDLCSACAERPAPDPRRSYPDQGRLLGGQLIERPGILNFTQDDVDALQMLPPIRMELDAVTAMQIMSTLQLACRHPRFAGEARETAERMARSLQEYLSVTPHVAEICEAGWNPVYDVPSERRIIVP